MTCHQALSLLDDYLDNELAPLQVADLESHIASCQSCRHELDSARALREMLRQSRESTTAADPGSDYWDESESLILARTVDTSRSADTERIRVTPISGTSRETSTLVRSFVLFAASLVLMISALYVGSQRQQMSTSITQNGAPILVAASLSDMMGSDHTAIVTKEEEDTLVRGVFALGAPGPVGRYTGLADLLSSY